MPKGRMKKTPRRKKAPKSLLYAGHPYGGGEGAHVPAGVLIDYHNDQQKKKK